MPFRLLTLVLIGCALALCIKTLDIIQHTDRMGQLALFSNLYAEEGGKGGTATPKAKPKSDEKPADSKEHGDKKDEKKTEEHGDKKEEKKEEKKDEKKDASSSEHGDKKDEKKDEGEHGGKKEGGDSELQTEKPKEAEITRFTPSEINILERLSDRRKKLAEWEEELRLQRNVLVITETRIDDKLKELRTIKTEVEDRLKQYEVQEKEKIESLVKIYENMKPKDAAPIFTELDTPVLLKVASHMKEKKLALIMAQMPPERAREVTVDLAEFAKIQKNALLQSAAVDEMLKQKAPATPPAPALPAVPDTNVAPPSLHIPSADAAPSAAPAASPATSPQDGISDTTTPAKP